MKTRTLTLIALLGASIAPAAVLAADSTKPPLTEQFSSSERQAHEIYLKKTREELAQTLGTGKDRVHYRNTLEKLGYHITSINKDEPLLLEYEIIKAGDSFEVHVDFKDGISTFVNVTPNIWKARATREALKDGGYLYTYPSAVSTDAHEASDRVRGKAWAEEKPAVEKELGVGDDRSYYRAALQKMGYTVTTTKDSDAGNLELEAVKGDTRYEIKVEFDEKSLKSTAVDVSTSIWETNAAERSWGDK